jgi:hypothetical protein
MPITTVIAPKPDPTSATVMPGSSTPSTSNEVGRIELGLPRSCAICAASGCWCNAHADCAEHDEFWSGAAFHHGE